jgi:SAM-dependent MidA family methyltransferase
VSGLGRDNQSHSATPGSGQRFQIIEAGAHRGRLARDILGWFRQRRTEVFERLDYWIIEPSVRRQAWQQQTLKDSGGHLRWARSLKEFEDGTKADPISVNRVIFSNELLDAFPVRKLGWDARHRTWFEWGVALERDQFVWRHCGSGLPRELHDHMSAALGLNHLDCRPTSLTEVLPDGFTIEVCPEATDWWRDAAHMVRPGRLLTIDYGLTAEELLIPERALGTLRGYHRHQLTTDMLARPGEQDLTAHVNFSALQNAGEAAGLKTETILTQAQFLTGILAEASNSQVGLGEWSPARRRQLQTLTHPEHLGRAFRVLVQANQMSQTAR